MPFMEMDDGKACLQPTWVSVRNMLLCTGQGRTRQAEENRDKEGGSQATSYVYLYVDNKYLSDLQIS